MGAVFFDADRDGDPDLYVVSGGVEYGADSPKLVDRLYINEGNGVFARAPAGTLPNVRDSGSCVAAADYDRDGDLDLFVGSRVVPGQYPMSPTSRLLRNDSTGGELKFSDATESDAVGLAQTGMVTSALWSDVDGDGDVDLLITHEWGPVKLYRNEDGRLVDATKEAGLAERLGWWNGISGCDVDHDGDIDYVVTNFGLNTKYRASAEQPVVMYYGDFEGYGDSQIVEAAEGGRQGVANSWAELLDGRDANARRTVQDVSRIRCGRSARYLHVRAPRAIAKTEGKRAAQRPALERWCGPLRISATARLGAGFTGFRRGVLLCRR